MSQSVAIIDLWAEQVAPQLVLAAPVVVLKATVTTNITLFEHVANFQPTISILFLRHPAAVVTSLAKKPYASVGGAISHKLEMLEYCYTQCNHWFDIVIRYEDCCRDINSVIGLTQSCGLPVPSTAGCFTRSLKSIVRHNQLMSEWCRAYYGSKWGVGNIHQDKWGTFSDIAMPLSLDAFELARKCCPTVLKHYLNSDDPGCGRHIWNSESREMATDRPMRSWEA
jgi:hypothetical protein